MELQVFDISVHEAITLVFEAWVETCLFCDQPSAFPSISSISANDRT